VNADDPQPVDKSVEEWRCPQAECTKPLSEHLVSQADEILRRAGQLGPSR